jgi:hypothetical protein
VAVLDAEATRRTEVSAAVAQAETEATRRTAAAADIVVPPIPSVGATAEPDAQRLTGEQGARSATANGRSAPDQVSPARRRPRWAATLVVLTVLGLVVNEVSVWTAARRIRVGIATGQNAEMQGLWGQYQDLTRRSLLGIGLVGVKGPMKERLASQAERIIADYRQDAPTVREAQWRDAATWLTDVLHLDPGDRSATARLRYCEGHLQRIDGETRKRKKLSAAEAFREAVAKFEEAGRVDNRWPDPYLGLARTYIYGLDDLDRAIAALKEAERRGYRPGNRELVQLADGYRSRGDRWRREAAAVRGLEQERSCLRKSADDYRQALDLYQKAIGFGEASASVRTLQARLDEVSKLLAQDDEPPDMTR